MQPAECTASELLPAGFDIAWEPLTDALCLEIQPLLVAHWREIAHYDDIPLRPNWGLYAQLDAQDKLAIYTARERNGSEVRAYAIFFVGKSIHYDTSLQATQDVIYVDHRIRGGRLAYRLLKFVEKDLRTRGVQVIQYRGKIAHPELGRLVQMMGSTPVDTIYCKRLDHA